MPILINKEIYPRFMEIGSAWQKVHDDARAFYGCALSERRSGYGGKKKRK